ncbi:tRNA (adenine(22)-N(1))-methyltransferase TrmK [Psychrosphaera aquimarina]|uniref:tRNA (Adenine(22)-N(1))-methyltransferase TrmK n=1 Tax=Psychrosphaera aquimarina TaxID=2044854 RepID=A0ABU3R0H9_9GAMM|nr:tRNA (adenine(22)-N(1))-methyltransferase TrmK [Psychrosphaera aquimarina]MDU0113176.1 tRNA (adenine(22)-N(1))-methyltransferase TrmK [Psychrosphaera aquimarina]
MLKLGKRLQQLDKLVTANYDHIWDCCCDHGYLGTSLLTRQAANVIHFVDIVPELMSGLNYKLNQFYPEQSLLNQITNNDTLEECLWKTHCIDVNALPLKDYKGSHLVIIAGVGGDLMTEFVTSICQQFPQFVIDFLLCPVHHQYTLRQQLANLNLKMEQEILVEENNRIYEVLLVKHNLMTSKNNKVDIKTISLTGDSLWLTKTEQEYKTANKYLTKTIQHYRRIQDGGRVDVANMLKAYEAVELRYFNF